MAIVLASFFSFTVGIIAGAGLDMGFVGSTVVSTLAYYVAHRIIKKLI